ncbi:uncharacterized protein B0I36DRAFT_334197 [Microdochium trichocladiopsis]|uniref:F-box domain-containing protein n=1 Tax=Microdochium trichocladiopsis TaxID=1682393 RepID=A0A9P8XWM3_9PEZI|nr:uncharacterized protein B0I36DRAFT_334197 [Microdochium trichocladiopsis]KAH7021292.1 hypothetical protein B0I36DRAFT_334197 [Microdochium trichocladiopsis]
MDEVRQYLDGLNEDQLRFARILLASRSGTDIVAQAPLEIVAAIVQLLDNASFGSCLLVSRGWRRRLLSNVPLYAFARAAYPSLFHASQPSRSVILEAFASTSRRDASTFKSVLHTKLCFDSSVFHLTEPPEQQQPARTASADEEVVDDATIRYANGKLAWCFGWTFFVLDDLHFHTRRYLYSPLERMLPPMMNLLALGDQLVVAYGGGHLFAWNHAEEPISKRWKRIASMPRHCETEGLRIVVVLDSRAVLDWDFATNRMSEISMQGTLNDLSHITGVAQSRGSWTHLGVLVHPTPGATSSFLSAFRSDHEDVSIWLYEVTDGVLRPDSYKLVPVKVNANAHGPQELPFVTIQKSNCFGSYQISFRQRHQHKPQLDCLYEYNIYSSRLTQVESNHHYSFGSSALWNNRLYHTHSTNMVRTEGNKQILGQEEVELCRHATDLGPVENALCDLVSHEEKEPERLGSFDGGGNLFTQELFSDDMFVVWCPPDGRLSVWTFQ